MPVLGVDEAPAELLNGAQVSALVGVIQSAAAGDLPADAAVEIMKNAFGFSVEKAKKTLAGAGTTFVNAKAERQNAGTTNQ